MKREDGFYWIKWNGEEYVAYWYNDEEGWLIPGFTRAVRDHSIEIGPRVQRDSEVVKQRDEAVAELKSIAMKASGELCCFTGGEGARYAALKKFYEALERIIARLEADNSGAKP